MNNYKVVNKAVVEVPTNQIIKKFNNYKSAVDLSSFLNNGGGFDGFTPAFFTINVNLPSNP